MAVLITGGLGVIGSWVARLLVKRGEQPILFDAREDYTLVRDIREQVTIIHGDVTDIFPLLHIVKDYPIDRIIHTAAIILAEQNPPLALRVNIWGTVNVLEVARLAGIKRVVYTSSKGVYGWIKGEFAYPFIPTDYRRPSKGS